VARTAKPEWGRGSVYRVRRGSRMLWAGRLPPIRDLTRPEAPPKRPIVYAKTQAEATAKLDALRARYRRWGPGGPQLLGPFLDGWLQGKEAGLKPRTWLRYRDCVAKVPSTLRAMAMTDVTAQDINGLLHRLAPPVGTLAAGSRRMVRDVLRTAYNDAIKQRLADYNPVAAAYPIKTPSRQTPVIETPQMLAEFVQAAEASYYRRLLYLDLLLGIRQGELLGLRWRDVDWDAGVMRIERQIQRWTKSGVERYVREHPREHLEAWGGLVVVELKTGQKAIRSVHLPVPALALLHEQQAEAATLGYASRDDFVFTSPSGYPLDASNLRRAWRKVRDQAGLASEMRFHDLRHSFGTLAAAAGVTIRDLTVTMGWSQSRMVDRYVRSTRAGATFATKAVADLWPGQATRVTSPGDAGEVGAGGKDP